MTEIAVFSIAESIFFILYTDLEASKILKIQLKQDPLQHYL